MAKIYAFLNEAVVAITSLLGIEPDRLARSIIISVLLVAIVAAVVVVIAVLRSLLSRDKQPNDYNAAARAHAVSDAIKPTSAEYERIVNDAVEAALLPVFRRIKHLENKVFPSSEDQDAVAQLHDTKVSQLYNDVQDVILPEEEEDVVKEEKQAQNTGLHAVLPPEADLQQAASPSEGEAEHTTIAQVPNGEQQAQPREENSEHTAVSQAKDTEQQEVS